MSAFIGLMNMNFFMAFEMWQSTKSHFTVATLERPITGMYFITMPFKVLFTFK